jgi:hypothetical protein
VRIRFQADADLSEDIVTGVRRREPGVDFRTATEGGLRGLDDEQVLSLAAKDRRILVSHDPKTMPRHFAEFVQSNPSPGVLVRLAKTGPALRNRRSGADVGSLRLQRMDELDLHNSSLMRSTFGWAIHAVTSGIRNPESKIQNRSVVLLRL